LAILAFVDLLGVKDRWHGKGRKGAEAAFIQLRGVIGAAIHQIRPGTLSDGAIGGCPRRC
jgi:hypothetical protein